MTARTAAACFLILGLLPTLLANDWDAWREAPQTLRSADADSVPRAIRAARNKFFDRVYGPPSDGGFTSGPDAGPIFEDIPTNKGITIALVQFADYATIRSASGKSLYTEVRMNVEQVLRDPSGTAQAGKDLTVILGGGTVRLPSGHILREYTDQGTETGLLPGHRYLAFMWHANEGEYFDCEKTWELSGGIAVPTYPLDIEKAKDGTSRLAGMPEDNFLAAVRGILAVAQ